jgi:hypothetical protein
MTKPLWILSLAATLVLSCRCCDSSAADEAPTVSLSEQLEKAKDSLAPTYLLAYKFAAGDEMRTKVIHLVTVETKIKGVSQTAKSRSVSTKLWRITKVDEQGNIVFENVVEHVDMWSSLTGRQEVRYDSRTDDKPPPGYEHVASSVGKVLSTITMDRHGRVIARSDSQPHFNPGIGELTIPFPNIPVKAGQTWSIPEEVQVRLEDQSIKKVQTRQQYKLEKVEAGVATISVQTQVLTPVNDPKVQSQLVQRLQRGTIRFDVTAGRLIHKQMDLDESVVGFNGPESHMQYLARFTEEPTAKESAEQTAAKDGEKKR